MEYELKFGAKFLARVSKLCRVNKRGIKGGDTVECYPFSVKGNTIGVRKNEDGKAVGPYVRLDIRSLRISELLLAEIELARKQLDINDKSSNLSVWLYSLEAAISVTKRNGRDWYDIVLPVMVVVEEYEHKTDLYGEIHPMPVNGLNLCAKQKLKIKEILSMGIDNFIKERKFLNGVATHVKWILTNSLDEIFLSNEEILIPDDEVSLDEDDLSYDDLGLRTREKPLRQVV